MRVLVVGAGMYVTGRGGTGTGTVLASIAQYSRSAAVEDVVVVARNPRNESDVRDAVQRIDGLLHTRLPARYVALDARRTLEKVLEETAFDCAIVSVPDHAHFDVTKTLLERGISTLVVKPLTPTVREARELTRLARENGCHGAVEFHKRFDETNLYALKAIREGALGQLLYVTVDYSQRISIPTVVFKEWASRTNIFQYLAVHYVDLIYFLTGYRPSRALAVGTRGVLAEKGIDTFDSIHATIVWTGPEGQPDLVSQFAVNWIDPQCSPALSDQRYKIIGTRGRLELNQRDRGVDLVTDERGVQAINPYFSEFLPESDARYTFSGYGPRSVEAFFRDVEALRSGATSLDELDANRPSFSSALPSTAVIEAVNSSLANGSTWESVRALLDA